MPWPDLDFLRSRVRSHAGQEDLGGNALDETLDLDARIERVRSGLDVFLKRVARAA